MVESLQNAERRKKPSLDYLFEDVYDSLPENLKEQAKNTRKIALNHANDYPTDVPLE
jgi:TPP-dependent pyruvate/acetoin dehydrogenase alpha subunit